MPKHLNSTRNLIVPDLVNRIYNLVLALIILLTAILLCACSSRYNKYTSWDVDKDNKVDSYEFFKGYGHAKLFRPWAGTDFSFPVSKLVNAQFHSMDLDSDRKLTSDEFDTGEHYFYFGFRSPNFKRFDDNENSFIDEREFNIHGTEAVIRMWDLSADHQISKYEMVTGLYRAHDRNNNGTIEIEEFNLWKSNMLSP